VEDTSLTDVRQRLPEASKRRTRVGIARFGSKLSKFAIAGHSSDGVKAKFPKRPFGDVYPSFM
jgi:hypothetical protein